MGTQLTAAEAISFALIRMSWLKSSMDECSFCRKVWQCHLWHESTPGHCHPSQLDSSLRSPRGKPALEGLLCELVEGSNTLVGGQRY